MLSWYETKLILQHSLSISMDALHVIVGVLVWFAAALIMRASLLNWRASLVLLLVTLVNEAVDLWAETWPNRVQQYGEGAKDVLLTMMLPSLTILVMRTAPWLFSQRVAQAQNSKQGPANGSPQG